MRNASEVILLLLRYRSLRNEELYWRVRQYPVLLSDRAELRQVLFRLAQEGRITINQSNHWQLFMPIQDNSRGGKGNYAKNNR